MSSRVCVFSWFLCAHHATERIRIVLETGAFLPSRHRGGIGRRTVYVLLTTQSVREARQPFPLYDNIEWKRQIGNRALAFSKPRSEMDSLCYYEGGGVE